MTQPSTQETIFDHSNLENRTSSRWCVYAHYDKHNEIQEYVYNALEKIKACGFAICFVSTNETISLAAVSRLKSLASVVIKRKNLGYDFGSYKAGLLYLFSRASLDCSVLLANDSAYGPFGGLQEIIGASCQYDIFGITDSIEIEYHVQSYFMLYSERLVRSDAFWIFWQSVSDTSEIKDFKLKQDLILKNEIGGSQHFLRHGFKLGAAFPYLKVLQQSFSSYVNHLSLVLDKPAEKFKPFVADLNSSISYWNLLLEMGCPYIKKELLLRNPLGLNLFGWDLHIHANYKYNIELILDSIFPREIPAELLYGDYRSSVASYLDEEIVAIISSIIPSAHDWAVKKKLPSEHSFIFDENFYLATYPDVNNAVKESWFSSGWHHYRIHGHHEGRLFKFI